jgi:hypothetical protein
VEAIQQRHQVQAVDAPAVLVAAAAHPAVVGVDEDGGPRVAAGSAQRFLEVHDDHVVGGLRQPHVAGRRAGPERRDHAEQAVERQALAARRHDEVRRREPAVEFVVERDQCARQPRDEQRDREHDPAPAVDDADDFARHAAGGARPLRSGRGSSAPGDDPPRASA